MTNYLGTAASIVLALLAAAMFGELVAAPVQETKGDVAIVHGGVGADDRALVEQQAAAHNLKLTFARKGSGAYLSDVRVVVQTKQGAAVIDTIASGPLLLARLPEGEYTVTATERDTTLTQHLAIKGKTRRDWVFRFDLPSGSDPELDAGK